MEFTSVILQEAFLGTALLRREIVSVFQENLLELIFRVSLKQLLPNVHVCEDCCKCAPRFESILRPFLQQRGEKESVGMRKKILAEKRLFFFVTR
jgi:hypothetical protein